jgi:hypothetical protein
VEWNAGGVMRLRTNGNNCNYVTSISQKQLDALPHPTLEDILMFLNGGRNTPFFLKKPKRFSDGSKECLTRAGARTYSKLISIIYACARLTNENVESMVETLDHIVGQEV